MPQVVGDKAAGGQASDNPGVHRGLDDDGQPRQHEQGDQAAGVKAAFVFGVGVGRKNKCNEWQQVDPA